MLSVSVCAQGDAGGVRYQEGESPQAGQGEPDELHDYQQKFLVDSCRQ